MSVKTEKTTEELKLSLNNGDMENMERCLKEWNFRNEQSLLRFILSALIESEDKKTIGIIKTGGLNEFSPADHLLNNLHEQ